MYKLFRDDESDKELLYEYQENKFRDLTHKDWTKVILYLYELGKKMKSIKAKSKEPFKEEIIR